MHVRRLPQGLTPGPARDRASARPPCRRCGARCSWARHICRHQMHGAQLSGFMIAIDRKGVLGHVRVVQPVICWHPGCAPPCRVGRRFLPQSMGKHRRADGGDGRVGYTGQGGSRPERPESADRYAGACKGQGAIHSSCVRTVAAPVTRTGRTGPSGWTPATREALAQHAPSRDGDMRPPLSSPGRSPL